MAGLSSTFHHPFKSQLLKPSEPSSFHLHTFSLRIRTPTSYPSISTTHTTISARYGGGSGGGGGGGVRGGGGGGGRGGGYSKRSEPPVDEALDISSIKSDTVRLIDEEQKMVGLVSKAQAFQMAEAAELDLVILSPDADPPVLRIMDYNKYKYEQHKKKRDQQKKSLASRVDLKELKMGYNIDVHDYAVRLRAAQKFLKDGDKVKVIVSLKGRQNEFRNNAIELLRRFQNDVGELATEEAKSFWDRNMFIVMVPNKAIAQKTQEPPKKKETPVEDEVSASV